MEWLDYSSLIFLILILAVIKYKKDIRKIKFLRKTIDNFPFIADKQMGIALLGGIISGIILVILTGKYGDWKFPTVVALLLFGILKHKKKNKKEVQMKANTRHKENFFVKNYSQIKVALFIGAILAIGDLVKGILELFTIYLGGGSGLVSDTFKEKIFDTWISIGGAIMLALFIIFVLLMINREISKTENKNNQKRNKIQ